MHFFIFRTHKQTRHLYGPHMGLLDTRYQELWFLWQVPSLRLEQADVDVHDVADIPEFKADNPSIFSPSTFLIIKRFSRNSAVLWGRKQKSVFVTSEILQQDNNLRKTFMSKFSLISVLGWGHWDISRLVIYGEERYASSCIWKKIFRIKARIYLNRVWLTCKG